MVTRRPVSVSIRFGRYSTDPNATVCRDLTASRGRCGGTFRVSVRADNWTRGRRQRAVAPARSGQARSEGRAAEALERLASKWGIGRKDITYAIDGYADDM